MNVLSTMTFSKGDENWVQFSPLTDWDVGGTWGTIQQRSSSSLFCRRPSPAVLAWAGISIFWCCPSSISSADHGVAPNSKCLEEWVWRGCCCDDVNTRRGKEENRRPMSEWFESLSFFIASISSSPPSPHPRHNDGCLGVLPTYILLILFSFISCFVRMFLISPVFLLLFKKKEKKKKMIFPLTDSFQKLVTRRLWTWSWR